MRAQFVIPVLASILILGIAEFPFNQAFAIGGIISDQASCETIGGVWSSPNICEIDFLAISSVEVLTVNSGIILELSEGSFGSPAQLTNSGTIDNFGSIKISFDLQGSHILDNSGIINNFGLIATFAGTIHNSGTINNDVDGTIDINSGTINTNSGTINNFGIFVYGNFENSGIINNSGSFISFFATINNSGIINNNFGGTINNDSGTINNSSSGTINNSGIIDNQIGTINNSGTIENDCGGIIIGTISGNPVVDICMNTPDAVTDLALTVISGTQVDLSWTTPDDGGSPITGYVIKSKVNGVGSTIETSFGDASTTSYSDTSLSAGDTVTYRIAAINAEGQGPLSNIPATVTTP